MDAKTAGAVANLRGAVKDYAKATKRRVPRVRGAHEEWGSLVGASAGDLLLACASVPGEKATSTVVDLVKGCGKVPPQTTVVVYADDVFEVLGLVSGEG